MSIPNRHEAEVIRKSPGTGGLSAVRRPLLLGTGWLCVGLGAVGIVMPLFPTTPFLLIALWAFSKSSPELATKIRHNRFAGRYVREWEEAGVIPPGAKIVAVTMMMAMLGYLCFGSGAPVWMMILAAMLVAGVAGFILTRPGRRPE